MENILKGRFDGVCHDAVNVGRLCFIAVVDTSDLVTANDLFQFALKTRMSLNYTKNKISTHSDNVAHLDKVWIKGNDVWIRKCECFGCTFEFYSKITIHSVAFTVNVEGIF